MQQGATGIHLVPPVNFCCRVGITDWNTNSTIIEHSTNTVDVSIHLWDHDTHPWIQADIGEIKLDRKYIWLINASGLNIISLFLCQKWNQDTN